MIISLLDKSAGFFSVFFFTINHFIYCKRNNKSFKINSENWLYKSFEGWTDYFKNVDCIIENDIDEKDASIYKHNNILGDYNLYEYQNAIRNHLFIYNDNIKNIIQSIKDSLGLKQNTYDSIYIRHGDKLCSETKMIPTQKYVDLLFLKNPNCKIIFVQTDDYNVFLEVEQYIKNKNMDIRVLTLCNKNTKGIITHIRYFEEIEKAVLENQHNKDYISKIKIDLDKTKPLEAMTFEEIYEHTINLLVSVDISIHSNYCVLDNQSNVARFISIAHNDYKKVFDVRYPNENIVMEWTMCPAYW